MSVFVQGNGGRGGGREVGGGGDKVSEFVFLGGYEVSVCRAPLLGPGSVPVCYGPAGKALKPNKSTYRYRV